MSFFDDASLAFLPSGGAGKDGKAYSIKPTDGTGDFTFSRGSNLTATRVGPTGLIEKGRENLLLQSNAFSTTPWNLYNGTLTSGQSGYDGSSDAWLLDKTGSDGRIFQSVSFSGVTTFSIYAKANTNSWIRLYFDTIAVSAFFDLANGVEGTSYGTGLIDLGIESVGNGWYRCSVLMTGSGSSCRIYTAEANSTTASSGSIYIQDAQLEVGLAATDYIESGASTGKAGLLENEPRFDYSGGATCPSLLLEPQRVNLVKYSEYYGSNLFVNSSPEINNTTSPEGVQNATLLKEDTNSGNHAMREPSNTSIAADDSQYVISFYAKSNGRNIRFIDDAYTGGQTIVNFNLSSGGTFSNGAKVIDSDAVAIGTDGWYHCYAVIDKLSAAQNNFRFSLRLLGGASNDNDSYTGDGTSGVWIWGKQVEDAVTYPTSYIPNHSGGSATRTADVPSLTGATSLIGQTEGTIYAELDFTTDSTGSYRILSYLLNNASPSANRVRIEMEPTNRIWGVLNAGGSQVFLIQSTIQSLGTLKIALAYKNNDSVLYINGVQEGTNTSSFAFSATLDKHSLSSYTGANQSGNGLKKSLLFKERLSNADLETLTTL